MISREFRGLSSRNDFEVLDNYSCGTIKKPVKPLISKSMSKTNHEVHMKKLLLVMAVAAWCASPLLAQTKINPTDPQPTCNMCPGTYIPLSELSAYTKKAIEEKLVDQQVRDID